MRASVEAAQKAGNGTHTAVCIGNLRFDEGTDESSRVLRAQWPLSISHGAIMWRRGVFLYTTNQNTPLSKSDALADAPR